MDAALLYIYSLQAIADCGDAVPRPNADWPATNLRIAPARPSAAAAPHLPARVAYMQRPAAHPGLARSSAIWHESVRIGDYNRDPIAIDSTSVIGNGSSLEGRTKMAAAAERAPLVVPHC